MIDVDKLWTKKPGPRPAYSCGPFLVLFKPRSAKPPFEIRYDGTQRIIGHATDSKLAREFLRANWDRLIEEK